MKINPINRLDAAYQAYQKNNQPKREEVTTKQQAEKVELSSEAKLQIQKEKDAKIEQLKSQIANGTYKVDSEKLADKLLSAWKSGAKIDE
ncbi:flagellar biosynthesis anti-sigma factor FlgM [Neobacillus sp. 3P2-tot-E-2]|uniref:flagellar biosynthesis anti-sigma factor FlgM n=1 Tax=Neobacillus sp. 3P2-tot-E-2 TaxID=3132212 RepID=UPI0039A0360F